VTCAYATALALRANASDPEKGFDKGNVFVLGQPQLHAELQTALAPGRYTYGLEMRNDNGPNVVTTQRPYDMRLIANAWEHRTLPAPQLLRTETQQTISLQELDIGAVVIGPDFCFSPATLALATMLLQRHKLLQSQSKAIFVATNDDATITYGKVGWNFPSTGSLLASLVVASGRQPDVCCGKPSKDLFDLLQSEERARGNEVAPEECIMVGDRLTTDIMFGRRAGTRTLFVLTGVEHECEIPSPRDGCQGSRGGTARARLRWRVRCQRRVVAAPTGFALPMIPFGEYRGNVCGITPQVTPQITLKKACSIFSRPIRHLVDRRPLRAW
jgi:4-nitrophenyl phosphatase